MKALTFYDLKRRKNFTSSEYKVIKNKRGIKVAVARNPSGSKSYRIIGK